MKKTISKSLLLALCGFFAGIANGLFGAGGGIIIVFALAKLFGCELSDRRDLFANALCVIFPLSLTSLVIYSLRGNISTSGFGVYVIPAVVGGVIGAFLLGKLKDAFLRRIFALIIVFSGVMLMVR